MNEYTESIGLTTATKVVDDEQVFVISIPRHDDIVCVSPQDIETSEAIMGVAASNLLSAEDLWTLLCVGVG